MMNGGAVGEYKVGRGDKRGSKTAILALEAKKRKNLRKKFEKPLDKVGKRGTIKASGLALEVNEC